MTPEIGQEVPSAPHPAMPPDLRLILNRHALAGSDLT